MLPTDKDNYKYMTYLNSIIHNNYNTISMTISKYAKFVVAATSIGLMASCSNDLEVDNGLTMPDDGTSAFMTINLHDVTNGFGTRADGDETSEEGTPSTPLDPSNPSLSDDFANGSKDEYKITSVRFFFFGKDGNKICESTAWTGGTTNPDKHPITLEGNTVAVLKGLKKSDEYPKFMITVLNGDGFQPKNTLAETAEALTNWKNEHNASFNKTVSEQDKRGEFIMTTASYYDNYPYDENGLPKEEDGQVRPLDHSDKYYYTTVLKDANFGEGEPTFDEKGNLTGEKQPEPVDVYVERLAAKVELDLSSLSADKKTYTGADGKEHTIYKLNNITIGGNANNEGNDNEGVTDLYVEILGWDLNSTARDSYLSKNISGFTFAGTELWSSWNIPQLHRSYWAKGTDYGKEIVLPSLKINGKGDIEETPGTLQYVNYRSIPDEDLLSTEGKTYRYANEYTNIPSKFADGTNVNSANLTHVVLKARVCDGDGNSVNLVRATNGVLFLRDDTNKHNISRNGYLSYVLNLANTLNGLNVWYVYDKKDKEPQTTTDTNDKGEVVTKVIYSSESEFKQVDQTMVKLVLSNEGTGLVKVVPNLPETGKYGNATSEIPYVYVFRNEEGKFEQIKIEEATARLTTALNIGENDGTAMAYTEGASYYDIPIEHNHAELIGGTYKEGHYGFVRNHWYKLSIKKLANIGLGVFNPGSDTENDEGEKIIPNKPKDPTNYVVANLKVLAWKLVNQDVEID